MISNYYAAMWSIFPSKAYEDWTNRLVTQRIQFSTVHIS